MKIALIGIDGLSSEILLKYKRHFKNFSELIDNELFLGLNNNKLSESPSIWTSIATGKFPKKHNIKGFTEFFLKDSQGNYHHPKFLNFIPTILLSQFYKLGLISRLSVQSGFIRCKTVWEILSENDFRVLVNNWWATYPAEQINGVLVSDHANYCRMKTRIAKETISLRDNELKRLPRLTFPYELFEYLISSVDIEDDYLIDIVNNFLMPLDSSDKEVFRNSNDYSLKNWLSILKTSLQQDEFSLQTFLNSFKSDEFDFSTLYLGGLDAICHYFWKYHKPEDFPWVEDVERDKFRNIIINYYKYIDDVISRILTVMPPDVITIFISDHGFKSAKNATKKTPITGIHEKGPNGVVILKGDIFNKQFKMDLSMVEITPLILYLFSLPVAKDMDGDIKKSLFKDDYILHNPVKYLTTYDTMDRSSRTFDKPFSEDKLEKKLKTLGYLD